MQVFQEGGADVYYLGTFFHTLDAKGRLFTPARFRENIGEEFVLFKSPDKCISIYDNANFEKMQAHELFLVIITEIAFSTLIYMHSLPKNSCAKCVTFS